MINLSNFVFSPTHLQLSWFKVPDDDETPLLVGHIPEKHYQSLQPKGKVNINCDNIF
jgi:hypothetical protein